MRTVWVPLALMGMGIAGHGLWGQSPAPQPTYPTAATVLLGQADVYSGPAANFYPTSRLRYGDRVIVVGESKKQPGWFEILPPTGSFSWIEAKYIKTVPGFDRVGIVDAGDSKGAAPVMPGSAIVNREPNVEIARVGTGTQVLILDRPTSVNGTSWYPIAPVATEVRYLPGDAIRGAGYAGAPGTPTTPVGWNGGAVPAGGWQTTAGPVGNPTNFVQLAQQGDQALTTGNVDRARLLYVEALSQTTDPAWRNYLTGQLQRTQTAAAPPTAPPAAPHTAPPATNVGSSPVATTPAAKQWSPWGVLRTAPFTSRDGQPMYILENRQNAQPLMYVTTTPGMSLRDYLGQTVAIYGSLNTRSDDYIRMQFIVAEQVATPPK